MGKWRCGMQPSLFIANYIIEYSNKKNYLINNLKLQKLLYFANVIKIVDTKNPLFEEQMEKWKYGPVVPSVYHEYKRFGAFQITNKDIVRDFISFGDTSNGSLGNLKILKYRSEEISKPDAELLKKVVDKFSKIDVFDLVGITHNQELWKKDEKLISDGVQGIKYTNDEIVQYFDKHPEELEWIK